MESSALDSDPDDSDALRSLSQKLPSAEKLEKLFNLEASRGHLSTQVSAKAPADQGDGASTIYTVRSDSESDSDIQIHEELMEASCSKNFQKLTQRIRETSGSKRSVFPPARKQSLQSPFGSEPGTGYNSDSDSDSDSDVQVHEELMEASCSKNFQKLTQRIRETSGSKRSVFPPARKQSLQSPFGSEPDTGYNSDSDSDSDSDVQVHEELMKVSCSKSFRKMKKIREASGIKRSVSRPTQHSRRDRSLPSTSSSEFQPSDEELYNAPENASSGPASPQYWTEAEKQYQSPKTLKLLLIGLKTLGTGWSRDASLIDQYHLHQRLNAPHNTLHCLYLPRDVHSATNQLDSVAIEQYTTTLYPKKQRAKMACTIVSPQGYHWFAVVADPDRSAAYIFGLNTSTTVDGQEEILWAKLGGPRIYRILCVAHGWPEEPPKTLVSVRLSETVHIEHIVDALTSIILSGLVVSDDGIPILFHLQPCAHVTRKVVLKSLHAQAMGALQKLLRGVYHENSVVRAQLSAYTEDARWIEAELMSREGIPTDWARRSLEEPLLALKEAMRNCDECASSHYHRQSTQATSKKPLPSSLAALPCIPAPTAALTSPLSPPSPHASPARQNTPPEKRAMTIREITARHPRLLQKLRKSIVRPNDQILDIEREGADEPAGDDECTSLQGGSSDSSPLDEAEDVVGPRTNGKSGTVSVEQAAYTGRVFPLRHFPPNPPKGGLKGLRVPFDETFDQYVHGPTIESLDLLHEDVSTLNFKPTIYYFANRPYSLTPFSGLAEWYDRGWRILPDFAQAFYLCKPWMVTQHLLPELEGYTAHFDEGLPENHQSLKLPLFLEFARKKPLFALDGNLPHNDGVPTRRAALSIDSASPTRLIYAVDIDSYICVTREPKFRKYVDIFAIPLHYNTAPMEKHNHVYVKLLVPQSPEDQATAGPTNASLPREEWFEKTFTLSQIPHMDIAHFKHGGALRVFFPRMTHRRHLSRYYSTNIDIGIKELFYREILGPAIQRVKPDEEHQYTVKSQEGWKHYQAGNRKPPTIVLQPDEMSKLIVEIKNKARFFLPNVQIEDPKNREQFSRFGSFFFVLEIKGTKHLTHVTVTEDVPLYSAISLARKMLTDVMDYWDFEHPDRAKGAETFIDFAVTATPPSKDRLVGLLHIDYLKNCFSAAGFRSQDAHRLVNMDRFGGLQAETLAEHGRHSHVVFSNGYNLAWEVARTANNNPGWFSIKDLATYSERYRTDRDKFLAMMRELTRTTISYGVRREFRLGDHALLFLLNGGEPEHNLSLENFEKGVTWVPLDEWSELLRLRMTALDMACTVIATRVERPKNYVQMCGVISYLMQSLTSTPMKVPQFTKSALSDLYYGLRTVEHGMFFIGCLNLEGDNIMPNVPKPDTYDIWRVAKLSRDPVQESYRQQQDKDPRKDRPVAIQQVAKELIARPWAVMKKRPHALDPELLLELAPLSTRISTVDSTSTAALAVSIFRLWTCMVWTGVKSQFKRDSAIPIEQLMEQLSTVQDLIEFWSVESRFNALVAPEFHPIQEELREAFGNYGIRWYFQRRTGKLPSSWMLLREQYRTEYEMIVKTLSDSDPGQDRSEFDKWLKTLFSYCQCLPRADDRNPWRLGKKINGVELVVNPAEYDMERLYNSVLAKPKRGKRQGVMSTQKEFWGNVVRGVGPSLEQSARRQVLRAFTSTRRQELKDSDNDKAEDDEDDEDDIDIDIDKSHTEATQAPANRGKNSGTVAKQTNEISKKKRGRPKGRGKGFVPSPELLETIESWNPSDGPRRSKRRKIQEPEGTEGSRGK
ncbi:hypothetical protein V5O48_009051 [Marasmius crinis-equi]|uniref:Ubiquitin-like protease family profile domain-containing protein n=1 Tax=Marasmius crinis-equi TaxID=585013 RepID=A0ABR3FC67_9AGAR